MNPQEQVGMENGWRGDCECIFFPRFFQFFSVKSDKGQKMSSVISHFGYDVKSFLAIIKFDASKKKKKVSERQQEE